MPKVLRSRAFDAFVPDLEPGEELTNARLLPLDVIEPNPYQARQAFEPEKLDELTASVREHGVLEPILVQVVAGDRYRILAGERRYRAATAAGLTQIPAIIREDLTEEEAAFITATENLQRADLDIEDEARQFAYLLELTGISQRALADKLGISKDYLYRRLLLIQHPEILAALRAGTLTQRDALHYAIHGYPTETPSAIQVGDTDANGLAGSDTQPSAAQPQVDTNPFPAQEVSHGATFTYHGSNLLPSTAPAPGSTGAFQTEEGTDSESSPDPISALDTPTDTKHLVERDDLDRLTIGDAEADLGPLPLAVPRWRYVEDAHRALRRIDTRTIPPGERPAWLRQVAVLEALVADLKRRLLALEGGPTDAI